MIQAAFIFLCLTGAIALAITTVRSWSGDKVWSTTKTIGFSAVCAILALFILSFIVILF